MLVMGDNFSISLSSSGKPLLNVILHNYKKHAEIRILFGGSRYSMFMCTVYSTNVRTVEEQVQTDSTQHL